MIFQDWLLNVAYAMGVTVQQAGVLLSFIITFFMIFLGLIATKGKQSEIVIQTLGLFCIILFTFMEWMPLWTGAIVAFIVSLYLANKIAEKLGG